MEKHVLAAASYYTQKYFINPEFNQLPTGVRNDVRRMCIQYSEDLHCVFLIGFYENGDIYLETQAEESDYEYDELNAKLEIKKLTDKPNELLRGLQLWRSLCK